jgi:ABC-type multidrug transport system fused ATPase/permease subunit
MKDTTPNSYSISRVNNLIDAVAISAATLSSDAIAKALDGQDPETRKYKLIAFATSSRTRLQAAWRFYFVTTVVNYVLAAGSFLLAIYLVLAGNYLGIGYAGAVAVLSVLSAALWKPHAKLLSIQAELFRISAMAEGLESLWSAIDDIPDHEVRAELASKALDRVASTAGLNPQVDRPKKLP